MEEEQLLEIDWVKKLPGDLWGGIAEYLPVEGDHLFNLAVAHPKISRKLNEDVRYYDREKIYIDKACYTFAHYAYTIFSKPIDFETLENIRKCVLIGIDTDYPQDAKNTRDLLREVLINPDNLPDVKLLKELHDKKLRNKFMISTYVLVLEMISIGLLYSEVLESIENSENYDINIVKLLEKASTLEWDKIFFDDDLSRFDDVVWLLLISIVALPTGILCLGVAGLCAGAGVFHLELFVIGASFIAAGLFLLVPIIPLKANSAKKINKRMDFISESRDYFVEKEFQENNANELVM